VQVTRNSVALDGGCNDWYIDPVSAGDDVNGNPIPGEAIGRLVYFIKRGSVNSLCLSSFMMSGGTRVFFKRLLILLSSQKIRIRRIAITNRKNWTLIGS
jgi:hypothetical protein